MKTTLNYGAIKDTVTKVAAMEVIRENANNTLFNFQNLMKESTILKKQHLIYKNLQSTKPFSKERLAERFLQQNLRVLINDSWDAIISENKNARFKLFGGVNEQAGEGGFVIARSDNAKLYEAIHTLIEAETNKFFSDFEKEAQSYEFVMEHLTREVIKEDQSEEKRDTPEFNKFWKFVTKNAMSNFNQRYTHLSEDEKKVFKVLVAEGDIKINYITQARKEALDLIKEKKNILPKEDQVKLQSFEEKLQKEVEPNILVSDDYIFETTQLLSVLKSI